MKSGSSSRSVEEEILSGLLEDFPPHYSPRLQEISLYGNCKIQNISVTVTERGTKFNLFLIIIKVKTLGIWREKSSDRDHLQQLRYEHPVRARARRPLRRKGRDGCTRDYWSGTTQEQLGPTECEIYTTTIHRATANWDWQKFFGYRNNRRYKLSTYEFPSKWILNRSLRERW